MNGTELKPAKTHNKRQKRSKFSMVWLIVFAILFIKSLFVLFSLYSNDPMVFAYSMEIVYPILFLISFAFIFSQKGEMIYLFCVDLFISILFIADIVYARAYHHLISFYMMFAKDVMGDLGASIFSLMKWTDFLMLLDLPILFVLILKSKKAREKQRIILFYAFIAISAALMFYQFKVLENKTMLGNYNKHPLLMSPIGNHMYDIYRFAYEKGDKLDKDDIASIKNWFEQNSKYQAPDNKYKNLQGMLKGKNIIVIQVESLENIMINKSYYGSEITPNINKLLKNSIYFSNIHEQVKDGNSSDAELLFNASVYPLNSGSTFLRFGENSYVSLPKLLHTQGYSSTAIHGDYKEFWNRDKAFPALGFSKYIDESMFDDKTKIGMGITDESFFNQSIKEIKKLKEPYNFFMITITSHIPYMLDKEKLNKNIPYKDYTGGYLQCINYTDRAFGAFYNKLKEEGLLENTVLVLYGDHEGIHKYFDTELPDNKLEIPCIIHVPGMKGFEMDKIGGQIDMMPTLMYLMGIDKSKYSASVMGRNLFGKSAGTVILPTGEIIGDTKDEEHLKKSVKISDMLIRGNYFKTN